MSGEPNNNQDQNQNVNANAGAGVAGEPPKKVELDAETYNQLLDTLAAYEALGAGPKKSDDDDEDDIDALLNQGNKGNKGAGGGGGPAKNLDEMTNTELVEHIMAIGNQRFHELDVKFEITRLSRAIDKVSAAHEDFAAYEEDIKVLAIKNPTLDIEDAYQLAKAKNPTKGAQKQDPTKPKTKVETILNLPSRQPTGEKPSNVAGGATNQTGGSKSLKTAAEEAWEEVVGKSK